MTARKHETRNHEKENIGLFRVFVFSWFRDVLSWCRFLVSWFGTGISLFGRAQLLQQRHRARVRQLDWGFEAQ
jgi:hypothetical protein